MLFLAVLLATVSNVLASLLTAHALSAEEFGKFSLLWVSGQLLTVLLFEPLRLCVVRYSNSASSPLSGSVIFPYCFLYAGLAVCLLVESLASALYTHAHIYSVVLAPYVIAQSLFDASVAHARATFQRSRFFWLWTLRSLVACVVVPLTAYYTGSSQWAVVSMIFSFVVAPLMCARLPLPIPPFNLQYRDVVFIFQFGVVLTLTGLSPLVVFFASRLYVANFSSLATVGVFSLAIDLAQKAVSTPALAMNYALLQPVIQAMDKVGATGASVLIRRNSIILISVLIPAGFGFCAVKEEFASLFLPTGAREQFSLLLEMFVLFSVVLNLKIYLLDSLFMIAGKAKYSLMSSAIFLCVTFLAFTGSFLVYGFTLTSIGKCLAVGALCSSVASFLFGRGVMVVRWPVVAALITTASGFGMYCVVKSLQISSSVGIAFAIKVAVGFSVYTVLLVAIDRLSGKTVYLSFREVIKK